MPSYRGVAQADLLKSINDALELLETHSTGPECQKDIDRLRAVDPATGVSPLKAIETAADDVALAQAMRGAHIFLFLHPVLAFHGMNDTEGKGLDVYRRLNDWGAMSGARMLAYTPIDGEMDSFLAAEYAKKLAKKLPVLTGLKNIFWGVATSGGDGFGASRHLNRLVRMARRGADDDALKQEFLKLDIGDRHRVVDAGAAANNMHLQQKNGLPKQECMERYGLVLPELASKEWNWQSPEVKAKLEDVSKTLEPYWLTSEVDMTGVGCITMDIDGPQGIMFQCTRRAAAGVARAFPGMTVIDSHERPVKPAECCDPGACKSLKTEPKKAP